MNTRMRETPLREALEKTGGKFVEFAGFKMPIQFAGIKKEHQAVRETAGLFDVSHMGEIWLEGDNALFAADYLVTNDIHAINNGQIAYTPMCLESGGIVDDLLVYRFSSKKILLVVNAANHNKDLAHIQRHVGGDVKVIDRSFETGQIALQGPKSSEIMANISDQNIVDLPSFHFRESTIAKAACLVSRTGYTGEDGFEIYATNDDMIAIFDALVEAGHDSGLALIGLGARDTLRLEAKLCLYGNDIDEHTTPLEAGLGWTVKLGDRDFLGKKAILSQKAAGITKRLVGFEMVDKGIARHGYPVVHADDNAQAVPIAEVCSGSPSPTLKKNIGLVYLPKAMCKKGTEFCVVIRGATKRAKVVKTPFYKRNI